MVSCRPGGTGITSIGTFAMVETLERRVLLSTFIWTNRGADNFDQFYGPDAPAARAIIDRALDDWGRTIVNFNRSSGSNTFSLNINAQTFTGTTRGSTSSIAVDAQGKPLSALIRMDDNGGGAGWYFDPVPGSATVPDDAEFDQLINPFMATSSTQNGADFYRTIAHEIGHAAGILIGFGAAINQFLTSTGVTDPVDNVSTLWAFNVGGGPVEATFTTAGGGHFYEGPPIASHPHLPTHPGDLLNPGRSVVPPPATRQLISDLNMMVLQQAYGYTVEMPSQINTFHTNFDTTTGLLTITGTDASDDIIMSVFQSGQLTVRVNQMGEVLPLNDITDIVIDPKGESDGFGIFGTPPGVEVRIRPSAGDDFLQVGGFPTPAQVILEGPVHRLGGLAIGPDDVVRLEPGADHVLLFNDELPINGTGRLDLSDGTMIIDNGDKPPIDFTESFLRSAYNNGAWTGPGIGTSFGDASEFTLGYAMASDLFSTFPATFAGHQIHEDVILIRFTRYGDADLNRAVDLTDFNLLASHFGQSERRFSQGNFNFDQTVDLLDFNLLASNFGTSAGFPLRIGGDTMPDSASGRRLAYGLAELTGRLSDDFEIDPHQRCSRAQPQEY